MNTKTILLMLLNCTHLCSGADNSPKVIPRARYFIMHNIIFQHARIPQCAIYEDQAITYIEYTTCKEDVHEHSWPTISIHDKEGNCLQTCLPSKLPIKNSMDANDIADHITLMLEPEYRLRDLDASDSRYMPITQGRDTRCPSDKKSADQKKQTPIAHNIALVHPTKKVKSDECCGIL